MANEFVIGAVIKATLRKILGSAVLLVLYTNSKLLYNYLVKLGITQEKHLMVDVMSLHQLYKLHEITEVKRIYGHHNLIDFMTKDKILLALKTLIDSNYINISITEWVKRVKIKHRSISI